MFFTYEVQTRVREEIIDITHLVAETVRQSRIREGICIVYVPHTTAGITINEHADPDVVADIQAALEEIVPRISYRHKEGNSPAHVKASLMNNSQTIIINNGALVMGTWQGVYFCEFDGPRRRKVHIKVVAD